MVDDKNNLTSSSTKTEAALDIASLVSSAVPWIGGPVSNVLGGMSLGRKLGRVHEVLQSLANDLSALSSDVSENYVKTEEFEDLLEQTLKRVGEERSEAKRYAYKAFLTDAISKPGESYDDQLHILRTFEQLSLDHICLLKALSQDPDPNPGTMGSPVQTLAKRLPELDSQRIEQLVDQLNDLRITNIASLKVMMTGQGASDLRHVITDFGKRILEYIHAP